MTEKHTPGPWKTSVFCTNVRSVSPEFPECQQPVICDIRAWPDAGDMYIHESNAKLIAAAPELLEALELAEQMLDPANHESFCECDPDTGYQCLVCRPPSPELAQIRAAIAKARGAA